MSEKRESKPPSHIAYQVRETRDGGAYFNRVGAAFPHKDGQGLNVELDAVPVDGRITLRTPKDRLDDMREDKPKGRGPRKQAARREPEYEAEYER